MSTTSRIFNKGAAPTTGLAVVLAAVALLTASQAARADQDCNWFAQTTAKQMQLNQSKNCNLKGDVWSIDMSKLVAWCQSVHPMSGARPSPSGRSNSRLAAHSCGHGLRPRRLVAASSTLSRCRMFR